jgi:uncharacterized membrane protein
MNKMMVSVFQNETDAYKGLSALSELQEEGAITLYGQIVITKDKADVITVKDVEGQGPIGTAVGVSLGALVGLLGGPVGAMVGGYGGSLVGMVYDLQNAGIDAEFIDDVSEAMKPNTVAVLADIEEEWMIPLDTKMIDSNGIVYRRLRSEVEEDQVEREVQLTKEEMDHLKTELQESSDEAKENIQKHIDAAEEKLTALANRAKEKQDKINKTLEEKVEALEGQIDNSLDKNKEKINATIATLKSDHNRRIAKLKRTYESAKSQLAEFTEL